MDEVAFGMSLEVAVAWSGTRLALISQQQRVGCKDEMLRGLQELCKVARTQAGVRGGLQGCHSELIHHLECEKIVCCQGKAMFTIQPAIGHFQCPHHQF